MMTENEALLLKNNISFMFRNGRLTAGHLAGCFAQAADAGDITAEKAFFGLYICPGETLNRLYRRKYIDVKFLTEKCLSWAKHRLLAKKAAPSERMYTPDFDSLIGAFSELFRSGGAELYGMTFVEICGDMLLSGCLYQADKKDRQEHSLGEMLGCISTKNILKSDIDDFHKTYLLRLRFGRQAFGISVEKGRLTARLRGKVVWREKKLKCRIHKIKAENGQISVQCEIGAPVFMLTDTGFTVIPVVNGFRGKAVRLCESCGCYRTYEKTAEFRWFFFSFPAEDLKSLKILFEAGGKYVTAECYAENTSFFAACLNFRGFSLGRRRIVLKNGELVSDGKKDPPENETDKLLKKAESLKKRRIWLYSDYSSVDADNGYFQFVHDLPKKDGILRFYIYHGDVPGGLVDPEKRRWVKFGSDKHKAIFLAAEKIFAAYVDAPDCLFPFAEWEYPFYSGIFRGEIIYLQHGVLHAHIPWRYSPVSRTFHCDRIVVSSGFEQKNFTGTYHFPNDCLIPSGMPRYDCISRKQQRQNRILYAPSWRAYMTDSDMKRFRGQICDLLNSPALWEYLSENDLYMDFKPHPMLESRFSGVSLKNERVRLVRQAAAEEYLAFITDFSSYVFDFVYLKTPVVYYFPDLSEFVRGKYQYRELDIPFDKGFGRLCATAEETVAELRKIAGNDFKMTGDFSSRAENFFIPLSDRREKLYRLVNI